MTEVLQSHPEGEKGQSSVVRRPGMRLRGIISQEGWIVLQSQTWTLSCAAARELLQGEVIGVLESMRFEIHRDLRKMH